jgi:NADH-quinone oxidoreductase subunit A
MSWAMEYLICLLAIGLAVGMVVAGLVFSRLVAPRRGGRVKHQPYECGEETIGKTWVRFNVGYYLIGLLFLVFDVEAAFLFPWAVVLREVGVVGLIEIGIFLLIVVVGLVYAWRKGALEWV